jgi:hypothetical protein
MFRSFQLNLNGYETCATSSRPLLREHKAEFFAERCKRSYPLMEAVARFAPTETVRNKVGEAQEKYLRLFGKPAEMEKMKSEGFCQLVAQRIEDLKQPPSNAPFDPELRKIYYNPERGPIPLIKKGRGPGDPVPYKVFEDPEPASSAPASASC